MKYVIVAIFGLMVIAESIAPAFAENRTCSSTCSGTGGTRTCTRTCY